MGDTSGRVPEHSLFLGGTKRPCGRIQAFLQRWDLATSSGGIVRYSYKGPFDLTQSLSVSSLLPCVPHVEGSVVPQRAVT